ncbi:Leukocyte elastase inhibitor [Thelohanellus kitauei]|uniref:Leukocyte elastase inhibitor n=1 Tax=Thelohanellus kitauei TaxID=669202 RepID=A0A0C2J1R2_THEKT|nr:Leukocyte elastase inhibitor [Thelohanellus kitauei]
MSFKSVNSFTSNIFNQLSNSEYQNQNIAFSGLNMYILLAAVNAGLKGKCYDQLSQFLEEDFDELYETFNWKNSKTASKWISLRGNAEKILTMQSSLFTPFSLFGNYPRIAPLLFDLTTININDPNSTICSTKINRWIRNRWGGSNGMTFGESDIRKNRLIFISTFEFQADWAINFNDYQTRSAKFFQNKSRVINVEMMYEKGYNYVYDESDNNFRILFKRMAHRDLYSVIVLPKPPYMIQEILKNLDMNQIYTYFEQSELKYVCFKLPKFQIYGQNEIIGTLKHFGITDIFDSYERNFGRMTYEQVVVGNITQFSKFIINEGGVRSAPTKKAFVDESIVNIYQFHVKKPFLYILFSFSDNLVYITAIVRHPTSI